MAINFPDSPTDGQVFTSGQSSWTYYSSPGVWKITSGPSGYTGSQGNIGYTGSASTIIGYTGSASTIIGYTGSQGNVGYTGSQGITDYTMTVALSDEATAITTGTAKVTFRAPFAMTLYQIPRASLSTASTSGNPAIDINKNGVSIFSTTLTIDANEKTSVTAATAAVLSTTSIADDDEITMDIDTAGTGAKGLKVTLYYRKA